MRSQHMAPHRRARLEHLAGVGVGEDQPLEIGRIVSEIGDGVPGAAGDAELRHAAFVEQPDAAMTGIGERKTTRLVDSQPVGAARAARGCARTR